MSDLEQTVYVATVSPGGSVGIQCRPTDLTMTGYGIVLATMVQATVNMFESAGVDRKEALDTILKSLVREARKPTQSAVYSETKLH